MTSGRGPALGARLYSGAMLYREDYRRLLRAGGLAVWLAVGVPVVVLQLLAPWRTRDGFALAAWVGLFATALNLLPLAQLDGGHLLYSVLGPAQRRWAVPLWGGLASLSFIWPGWGVWAAITLAIGLRHPPVHDETPLDRRRLWVAAMAFAILLLSFAPVPLSSLALP